MQDVHQQTSNFDLTNHKTRKASAVQLTLAVIVASRRIFADFISRWMTGGTACQPEMREKQQPAKNIPSPWNLTAHPSLPNVNFQIRILKFTLRDTHVPDKRCPNVQNRERSSFHNYIPLHVDTPNPSRRLGLCEPYFPRSKDRLFDLREGHEKL